MENSFLIQLDTYLFFFKQNLKALLSRGVESYENMPRGQEVTQRHQFQISQRYTQDLHEPASISRCK